MRVDVLMSYGGKHDEMGICAAFEDVDDFEKRMDVFRFNLLYCSHDPAIR